MVVVGGGPAGLVLALLLVRGGFSVTVLEKHHDFLRDFRGDTVHASTLAVLDELGLDEEFAAIPPRWLDHVAAEIDGERVRIADLTHLPSAHRHIALVPQWDFLELIARAAAREPGFRLLLGARATGLLRTGVRITGVRYETAGTEHQLAAALVVACDGRDSDVSRAAGREPRAFGAPLDVWWFRIPRQPDDPSGGLGVLSGSAMIVLIDRGDYFQAGYLIAKGSDARLRAEGSRHSVRGWAPPLPGSVNASPR